MLRSKLFQAVFNYGLLVLAVYGFAVLFTAPLTNPDFFWHLATGKIIVQTKALVSHDVFSWTLANAKWVNFEWLTQVIYYLVWQLGGYTATFLLKILLLSTAAFILFKILRLYAKNDLIAIMMALWAAGMTMSFDIRPENFTLVFLMLTMLVLEKLRLRLYKPVPYKFFIFGVIMCAIWANLHAGLFYAIALIGSYAAGEIALRFYEPVKEGEKRDYGLPA